MGCGSSQAVQPPLRQNYYATSTCSDHSGPPTSCSSLEHVPEADSEGRAAAAVTKVLPGAASTRDRHLPLTPRPRHKPQAEFWAHPPPHPPLSPPRGPSSAPSGRKAGVGKGSPRTAANTPGPGRHALLKLGKRPARTDHHVKDDRQVLFMGADPT
ncbi:uncharacterized protein LOC143288750 [Babylonia areolata]|uniref:uncharacterized protein LOC143288750 n=1 Tax=Babylonia areolata TaxID=304850 RepID=UPI003FD3B7D2